MPRKKLATPAEETPKAAPAPEVSTNESPKKPRRTAKKAAPTPPEVVEAAETVSEPAQTVPAAPKSNRRTPAKKAAPAPAPAPAEEAPVKASSRGKKSQPAPAPAVAEKPKPARAPKPKPTRAKVTTEAKPDAAPERVEAPEAVEVERGADYDYATLELPEPVWRSHASVKAPVVTEPVAGADEAEAEDEEASEDSTETAEGGASDDQDAGRRRRRRRRRGGRREEAAPAAEPVVAAAAAVEAPVEEPEPEELEAPTPAPSVEAPRTSITVRRDRPLVKAPDKAAISIPAEAPQVVVRNGVPTLVRNHRVYPPIMFFGSPDNERRAETVMEEVRMASEAGVHLHSYLVELEVDPATVDETAAIAAYMLAQSVKVDSESQVIFRVVFQAPRDWEFRYAGAKYRYADGSLAEPSLCDDEFWGVARTCLERFVKQMRLLELRDHILGLHLERGEWFTAEGAGYDDSRAAQAKFRDWARTRYLNDEVTLRASWFDGQVRFDNIQVPAYQPQGQEGDRFIRSSRRQRRYVDYHLFLSDATVSRIADLAYSAKLASDGYFLIGASYGYTFEWSHPASGHLSLGKLLRTPEIDFIAGPPSYRNREPGGSAPFPGPIDSFALNGKLYISEEDFKTSLSLGHEPDDFNPQMKTPQALESVHWRGVGAALAHASGVAWMDLWGNGWLRTNSVWERAKKVREALVDRLGAPLDDPDVAVFIDERALAYLVDSQAFTLLVQNVRESVLRAGVSAAFYLLSDLAHREKFPESKLYLFVNAWDIRPELRAAIKSRLQRDNKVLFWLYSAGLFDAGRESLERAREVTGIALKPQPFHSRAGTTILNRRHPLSEAFPERSVAGGSKMEPSYFAIPEGDGATVLGEYTQTGLPSFVLKEFKEGPSESHWTSVFLGEPMVNPALIRALAQMAGAHVWNFHEDVVHVRHPFCTVHCKGSGPRTLTLPGKYSAFNLLNNDWATVDSSNLRFNATDGSTHCFLVGPKDELEGRLNADPTSLLRIDKLPPRESNIREDSSNFDVPIMKLDEWMEGSDSDDNADEWFLRPHNVEEEEMAPAQAVESPERVGRRRRRRRGDRDDRRGNERGRGGVGPEEGASSEGSSSSSSDFDDLGLSVVFRKRD